MHWPTLLVLRRGGDCQLGTGLCECFEGFYGDYCELKVPCYENKNQCKGHGTCDQSSGDCYCRPPYFGALCQLKHQCFEEDGACRNGGTCNSTLGNCDCSHDPAITGSACEITYDCTVVGCSNGGTCLSHGSCGCPKPYHGLLCDLVNISESEYYFCSEDSDCYNGTCDVETGLCSCADPASYGTLCEKGHNCTEMPFYDYRYGPACLNGGACDASSGNCDCVEPFFGPDCSETPPCLVDEDCDSLPGMLPDSLRCDTSSGHCFCIYDYSFRLGSCKTCFSNDDCYFGGSCNRKAYVPFCECGPGRAGTLCEGRLAEV